MPDADLAFARERQLVFEAATKVAHGAQWQTIFSGSLPEAMAAAQREAGRFFETGVFKVTPSGGLFYWSSRHPDVFNTLRSVTPT